MEHKSDDGTGSALDEERPERLVLLSDVLKQREEHSNKWVAQRHERAEANKQLQKASKNIHGAAVRRVASAQNVRSPMTDIDDVNEISSQRLTPCSSSRRNVQNREALNSEDE